MKEREKKQGDPTFTTDLGLAFRNVGVTMFPFPLYTKVLFTEFTLKPPTKMEGELEKKKEGRERRKGKREKSSEV